MSAPVPAPYWALALYCAAFYLAGGCAVALGYHRGLAHGSIRYRKGFERLLVLVGLPAGTPIQWVGTHRRHHACVDAPGDPHSPVRDGFWHAHCGWYIGSRNPALCALYALAGPLRTFFDGWHRPRGNQEHVGLARDIAADSFYAWISRPAVYTPLVWTHAGASFGVAWLLWGWAGVLALWGVSVVVYNLGDAVDSVGHLFGERSPKATAGHARNQALLALLTLGDGWHADHHERPASARLGFAPGRVDIGWWILRLWKRMGLVLGLRDLRAS